MKSIFLISFVTFSFVGFSQNLSKNLHLNKYDITEGLRIQNDIRESFGLKPYAMDSTLNRRAQERSNHLAIIDSIDISTDELGESVFYAERYNIDQLYKSLFQEATINWIVTREQGSDQAYQQITSEKATKIGVGFAQSLFNYYVVAKYDSIY